MPGVANHVALQGEEQGGEGAGDAACSFVAIHSNPVISSSHLQEKKNAADTTNGESKQTKKDKKESEKKVEIKNGSNGASLSLHNLSQQLDVAEEAQVGLEENHPSLIGNLQKQHSLDLQGVFFTGPPYIWPSPRTNSKKNTLYF